MTDKPELDPVRVATTFVHGVHLVQPVTLRSGVLKARGRYHLAQHGPAALCGTSFALDRVSRRDLYTSELVHPEHGVDVCPECIEALGQLRPELVEQELDRVQQRVIVEGQDDEGSTGLGAVRIES